MSVTGVIVAAVIVGCTGCLMGFFLCFASEKFKVEVDEREEAIIGVLPGNNCGGCGYAGCSGLAAAIVKEKHRSMVVRSVALRLEPRLARLWALLLKTALGRLLL